MKQQRVLITAGLKCTLKIIRLEHLVAQHFTLPLYPNKSQSTLTGVNVQNGAVLGLHHRYYRCSFHDSLMNDTCCHNQKFDFERLNDIDISIQF